MRFSVGVAAAVLCACSSVPSQAADMPFFRGSFGAAEEADVIVPYRALEPLPELTGELGLRYWYSSSRVAKDLYDDPRFSSNMNSRLTYSGMGSHSGEVFGQAVHRSGIFFQGYAGLGATLRGSLKDEDFPPAIEPYSSTQSTQHGGHLTYFSADAGYNLLQTARFKFGAFIGYHYLNETEHAYGCVQTAGNPFICASPINDATRVISEESTWSSVRVGLAGEVTMFGRLKLAANAAWLPYTTLSSRDTHWLRTGNYIGAFSGAIPQSGTGDGVQVEAVASYAVTDSWTIGVGARYWRMQTKGHADLEQTIIGFPNPVSQPLNFRTERFGAFVQSAYRFAM